MSGDKAIREVVGSVFNDIADAIETGKFASRIKIGLTTMGSEHGLEELVKAAEKVNSSSGTYEIVLIGPKVETNLKTYVVNSEDEMHKKMEELLDNKSIWACVTMHYNFPIGVATVGRVVTPARGKPMFIATTTGTSAIDRIGAMIMNALYGIITAKASGILDPTVGILNVDGARQVEKALRQLKANGYDLSFAESVRDDGGPIMRGNDLLMGTPDVMVQDTLTGNVLTKVLSAYSTGGDYESLGYGYGPGIGVEQERIILILSRASGLPVVVNALEYGAELVQGKLLQIKKEELQKANRAGLAKILESYRVASSGSSEEDKEIKMPPKEIVTATISGIDILDLDEGVKTLWTADIYAETGMGCTGPVIMVSENKMEKAVEILKEADFISGDSANC